MKRTVTPLPAGESGDTRGDGPSEDTLLAAWTAVFPLSHGLAHRVRLHAGPDASAEVVTAIESDYVQELSRRVPSPSRINADGDLIGPRAIEGTALDVLFTAVFTTDLDAIVQRHLPDVTRVGT